MEPDIMMKFSCEKALLKNAVNIALQAVAKKSSVPALEGVMLRAGEELEVCGYNLSTGIRARVSAEVGKPGTVVLDSKTLSGIISKMPDDMVTICADAKQAVHISCGDASFNVAAIPADDYPAMPEVKEGFRATVRQGVLRDMISQTAFAISTNEARPIHTGALFEFSGRELTVVAVDGFRLAVRKEPVETADAGPASVVVPGAALAEVRKICKDTADPVEIITGGRHILFEAGDIQLICRRLEGEFLDYKSAVPRGNPVSVVADTKELIQSVDRVSVVISEKLKSPVRCLFDRDSVTFSAKTAMGEAKDVCGLRGDGQKLEIGFNSRYLMEALRYAPDDTVRIALNSPVTPVVISPADGGEAFLYMVLPVRLRMD